MCMCSFLSTIDENVECFKECPFYKWSENDGKCPFNHIKTAKTFKMRAFNDFDLFKNDKSSPISLLYR